VTFTDDDLAEFKAHTKAAGNDPFVQEKTLALIARLEAAELLADCLSNHEDLDPVEVTEIANWRKAAGK